MSQSGNGAPTSARKVRKAVLPAAGLGTRFLPATKAQPKEMLTVVDKPQIQYVVENAWRAASSTSSLSRGKGKNSIEDHFDYNPTLERFLEEKGRKDQAALVRRISEHGAGELHATKRGAGIGARGVGRKIWLETSRCGTCSATC